MLSPSSKAVICPLLASVCSKSMATVLLPEPLKPVNLQMAMQGMLSSSSTCKKGHIVTGGELGQEGLGASCQVGV